MAEPTPKEIEKVIDGQMQELMKTVPAGSGLSAGFYCPSHPHVKRFYNYGRANEKSDFTEHTIVCIGSTTKVFTGSLIAYLHILDKVGPINRDKVKKFLPDIASDSMTLLQLATHTSGMPENGPKMEGLFQDEPPPEELRKWWADPSHYDKTVGSFVYSNIGFATLGYAAVSIANGGKFSPGYSKYLGEWITSQTDPPMRHTWTQVPEDVPPELIAVGHVDNETRRIQDGSDIKSTTFDLHSWVKANLDAMHGPSTPFLQALENATSVHLSDIKGPGGKPTGFDMGLGWQISNKNPDGLTVISKDGGVRGVDRVPGLA